MKHFTIGRIGLALLATTVVCLSQAAVASAGGGNSANAKLCQKGGWQTLVRADGSPFASQGDCVSYAAQGGTLAPKLTLEQQWQAACQNGGGSFATSSDGTQWQCGGGLSQATYDALAPICTDAGGTPGSFSDLGGAPYDAITCDNVSRPRR